jgi:hypothetical protein
MLPRRHLTDHVVAPGKGTGAIRRRRLSRPVTDRGITPIDRPVTVPIVETNSVYGQLQEGLHISGYTFARACSHLEWLLTDHRWRECGPGFEDVNRFLDSLLGFNELRAVAEQRKHLAKRIKDLEPKASNRQIARTLGVHHDTIDRDLSGGNPPRSSKTFNISNSNGNFDGGNPPPNLSGAEVERLARRQEARLESTQRAKSRREDSRSAEPLPDGMELRIGDCREVLADIADNSIALVLTDPPYVSGSEPLYRWLAEWSARVLIPGGSLICYTGHWSLNRDMRIFDEHLRYWWVLAMMHTESRSLPGKFVIANFKPVIWYVKKFRRGRSLIPDVLRPSKKDKSEHEWAQGEAGVTHLIEELTTPAELILDPFAGTGTWGKIAASMGRRWIGADIVEGGATAIKV